MFNFYNFNYLHFLLLINSTFPLFHIIPINFDIEIPNETLQHKNYFNNQLPVNNILLHLRIYLNYINIT